MALAFHILNGLRLLIIADAVFSWIMAPDEFPRSLTMPILDPVYAPLRRLLSGFMQHADLSPLIALFILWLIQVFLEKQGYREPR